MPFGCLRQKNCLRKSESRECSSEIMQEQATGGLLWEEFPGVVKEMEIGRDWCLQMSRG